MSRGKKQRGIQARKAERERVKRDKRKAKRERSKAPTMPEEGPRS